VQNRLRKGARGARHDRWPGRIPLVDHEGAPDAVAQQLEGLPRCVFEGPLRRLAVRGSGELEEDVQGSLHLQRRLPQEPQAVLVLRACGRVLDQQVDEAEHAEERVGDVVRDVGSEVAERSGASERSELAFEQHTLIVRKRQYC